MASIFRAFCTSAMAKRLLRYALSRLDFLDADALDLEKLELAIGKRTVLEFRDVGIIVQKLEKVLRLPATVSIQQANVLLLRVVVPVDFYASPIEIDVDGVDVRLRLVPDKTKETVPQQRSKGKGIQVDSDVRVVLTAADLARSFLETQPQVAKQRQLKESVAADQRRKLLDASVAPSDLGSEDEFSCGTGQALNLPAFLTDFLQGIVDRTQIRIRTVTFQLAVDVTLDLPSQAAAPGGDAVAVRIALDEISVEAVTAPASERVAEQEHASRPEIMDQEGKRKVSLGGIRAFLVSEANVFSSLARSPSVPSPQASQSWQSPFMTEERFMSRQATMGLGLDGFPGPKLVEDADELAESYYALQDSEDAFNIPYDLDGSSGHGSDDQEGPASSLSTPRASVYHESAWPVREGALGMHLAEEPEPPQSASSVEREAWSEPGLGSTAGVESAAVGREPCPVMSAATNDGSEAGTAMADDLAESRLYSHEEAQSMYMSAFSGAQQESSVPVRRQATMPGAWDDFEECLKVQETRHASRSETNLKPRPQRMAKERRDAATTEAASAQPRPTSRDGTRTMTNEAQAVVEADQDNPTTTRGPTRLVKEMLSLGSVSVYIPQHHKHGKVTAPDLGTCTVHRPGAFSVRTAATAYTDVQPVVDKKPSSDQSIAIVLGPLEVRIDASIGFLLAKLITTLRDALKSQVEPRAAAPSSSAYAAVPDVKLTMEMITLLFLEKLAAVADTPPREMEPSTAKFGPDILFKANLEHVKASILGSPNGLQTDGKLDIEKFRFGYGYQDMISFIDRPGLEEPLTSSMSSATGLDMSVSVAVQRDARRCHIKTLPVKVMLDLPRLDETFGRFGRLCGFFNMGSSTTSSVTSRTARSPQQTSKAQNKSRSVKFEAPIEAPIEAANAPAAMKNKLDVRINGLMLDLIGRECTFSLDTSALKLVSRQDAVGAHVSKARLAGPFVNEISQGSTDPVVTVDLSDTRFEYVAAPTPPDLDRFIQLVSPSDPVRRFEEESEDVIMVDMLLRQRRKGAVLRVTADKLAARLKKLALLDCLANLGEDLAKLGTVAKYLPEDDRPGLLTLGSVKNVDCHVQFGRKLGTVSGIVKDLELAHMTLPSLMAAAVGTISVVRNQEELVRTSSATARPGSLGERKPPVLMMRTIDDMESVLKLKLVGLELEYRVPFVMDLLGLGPETTPQEFEDGLAASVADWGEQAQAAFQAVPKLSTPTTAEPSKARPIKLNTTFKNVAIGLNPMGLTSKMVLVLYEADLEAMSGHHGALNAVLNVKKASVLLTNDASAAAISADGAVSVATRRRVAAASSRQLFNLSSKGFIDICQISSATITLKTVPAEDGEQRVDMEIRDDLLVLETCADSTHTLMALANALKPPTPPSKAIQYRTSVMPVQDLLASITADAFGRNEGEHSFEHNASNTMTSGAGDDAGLSEDELALESPFNAQYSGLGQGSDVVPEPVFDATASSLLNEDSIFSADDDTTAEDTKDGVWVTTTSSCDVAAVSETGSDLAFQDNYFGTESVILGTAHLWNSKKGAYDRLNKAKVQRSPLRISVRDVHFIWNLFDGYDWDATRNVIAKAAQDVEAKALEKRARTDRRAAGLDPDGVEQETEIGDFLFNSIWVGVPPNRDPRELAQHINQLFNDNATETESVATTALTTTMAARPGQARAKKLRLGRSKHHKVTFELKGINADVLTFPPDSGETLSSIDVRVRNLDIFDHMPTSTWRLFATYDEDVGEREMGAHMMHLEMLNTRPVAAMPASETVLKVAVLPLRLHVDQDTLDFLTRFFAFQDTTQPMHASATDVPFIQRAEIQDVAVKLDFKPKRVDYAGLRSGQTTEFMNFVTLEGSRMTLRRVIIYGVSGFDRLGKELNNLWMADVKRKQLPGVLAGIAPVRSLVNAGSGIKDLVEIPIREYRRDGRLVRALGRGAAAFAKTSGTEVVKLGAKLAIGTQYALQGAEGMLGGPFSDAAVAGGVEGAHDLYQAGAAWDESDDDDAADSGGESRRRQISLYADQPVGIVQGVRGGYASLARDLSLARDAIIAVPGEVMESTGAGGAAKAVLRRAPTIIFRPAMGLTKVIGKTLLGATNTLDPQNRRRMEAKYKT